VNQWFPKVSDKPKFSMPLASPKACSFTLKYFRSPWQNCNWSGISETTYTPKHTPAVFAFVKLESPRFDGDVLTQKLPCGFFKHGLLENRQFMDLCCSHLNKFPLSSWISNMFHDFPMIFQ